MKKLSIAAFILSSIVSASAMAACTGTGNFKTCYDYETGNQYTVQKFGGQTVVNGSNTRTGSTWSQRSNRIGNSTYTTGTASNGNNWNSTTSTIGGNTYTTGTDSNGNYFSKTCNKYGCY